MRIFFDTSVLVAASVRSHDRHAAAYAALRRILDGSDDGFTAGHTLLELYAVLTRLPVSPRVRAEEAAKIISENIIRHFKVESLKAGDYASLIGQLAGKGVVGGVVYDALLLACAEKAQCDRIYTYNVADFRRLAPQLEEIITAP